MPYSKALTLFGGEKGWNASDWTASDDRVRGGISQSYLDTNCTPARFYGTLDITALGGAGFASQRTASDTASWDLSAYSGIHLSLGETDGKKYTFILKDELLPPDPITGREQSTVSWEFGFTQFGAEGLFIPWDKLEPTYRGRPVNDSAPLKTGDVKRFSIMNRSNFGEQQGDFSLSIESIKAVYQSEKHVERGIVDDKDYDKPRSWKDSRLVGLAVILSATWAVCYGFCWWKGIDTSHMTFSRWWKVTGSKGFGL